MNPGIQIYAKQLTIVVIAAWSEVLEKLNVTSCKFCYRSALMSGKELVDNVISSC